MLAYLLNLLLVLVHNLVLPIVLVLLFAFISFIYTRGDLFYLGVHEYTAYLVQIDVFFKAIILALIHFYLKLKETHIKSTLNR